MGTRRFSRREVLTRATLLATASGAAVLLGACGSSGQPAATPAAPPTMQATAPATAGGAPATSPAARTGSGQLPPNAAPADKQVLTIMGREGRYLEWSKTVRDFQWSPFLISEPPVRPDINYELQPAAAEKWEIAPDGMSWTFHFRPGMKWSDGTPVTANDYVYTIRRMADPNTGFDVAWFYAFIKGFKAANEGKGKLEDIGAKATDDLTLTIETEQPTPFLSLIMTELPPVPQHVVSAAGDNWSLDPKTCLSCGPFKLEAWDKGRQVVFVNNPAYNGPSKAPLSKIVYKIGEDTALFPAYENNEIDAITRGYEQVLSPADQARVESDPDLSKQLHKWPQFQTWWVSYDSVNAAFKDTRVRQAFSHAIDRDALINSALKGQAVPAWGLLPPGFYAYNLDNVKGIQDFNPAKAKQLLAAAGYPDGKGFPRYDMYLRAPSPTVKNVAQAIQAMLKQNLGVDIGIQSYEQKSFMDRLNSHNLPLWLISWDMDYYDASNFMDVFKSGGRNPWKNDEYDRLVASADSTMGDDAKRKQLYQQAEKLLVTEAVGVFLWHPIFTQLWKPYIAGDCFVKNKYGILGWQEPQSGPQYYCAYITKDKK
ncbi:MAG TPA: peptide ABC transporter substrate-binding protein [Thermomicrobiales bacterium]|nr:peptide ABC transporter substrate-binding protein [Thermomicrobiales bacterium]